MQNSEQNTCAICLSNMDSGGGQALFTAECSHSFHFQCISSSVAHGNLVCPLCKAQWKELPFMGPRPVPQLQPAPRFFPSPEPRLFNDDDPVDPPQTPVIELSRVNSNVKVEVKTYTEYPAIPKSSLYDDFAIVVHLKAPGSGSGLPESARAPVDLVTVLDVSGSMAGAKLDLLKQAMGFVIQNLGPADRLSIISFSSGARRLFRLSRMSEAGASLAMRAVDSLMASGGTHIAEGLRKGAKILEERQYKNPVSSIILLSDGQDTYTVPRVLGGGYSKTNYGCLLPPSILHASGRPVSIHTFGFGTDHDALAMHRIAEASGGTFSFIEDSLAVQDAFAQCIGGLLSVVAQESHLGMESANPGVRISGIKSGSYESRVEAGGWSASIDVGELYADEERSFLLFVNVPQSNGEEITKLIKVNLNYKDAVTGLAAAIDSQEVSVERPDRVDDMRVCIEVEREKLRVQATEDMAAARAAAERGAMNVAVGILENRQRMIAASEVSRAGDTACGVLQQELRELQGRMSNRHNYESSGRAYALSGLSAYSHQRATTRISSVVDVEMGSSSSPVVDYQTPSMLNMVRKSQISRGDGSAGGRNRNNTFPGHPNTR